MQSCGPPGIEVETTDVGCCLCKQQTINLLSWFWNKAIQSHLWNIRLGVDRNGMVE